MYYFDNDPLESVYRDLADGKTPTHFDQLLALQGTVKEDFHMISEKLYTNHRPGPNASKLNFWQKLHP